MKHKLSSISQLLDTVIDSFRNNYREYLMYGVLLQAALFLFSEQGLGAFAGKDNALAGLVLSIVRLVVMLWIEAALFMRIIANDPKAPVEKSFRDAYPRIASFAWLMILQVVVSGFGLILLIIPGLIFMTWFSLSPVIFFTENLRGKKAMDASRSYVSGHGLAVFGRLALFMFLLQGSYFIIGSLFRSFGLQQFSQYAVMALGALFMPVIPILLNTLYGELKGMKA